MLNLIFNNIRIPDWIKVVDIKEDLLSSDNKTKKIKVDFKFKRNKLIDAEKRIELIDWIKGDDFKESKLILPDRLNFYYMAKAELSDITGSIRRGEGSIEFTCYGSYINTYENKLILNNNTEKLIYYGDVEAYPTLKIKVKSACSKIKIIHDLGFIELNNSFNAGNVIEFNQDTFNLKLNNNTNMQILHLSSTRFYLDNKKINKIKLEQGNCEVELSWNNKYL